MKSLLYTGAICYALLLLVSCQQQAGTESNKSGTAGTGVSADPLPSWNDGETKKAIVEYITKVTKEGSPDFIPEEDRIATFDNDGTLWSEKPYVQELFAFFMAKKLIEKHPSLVSKQPFKAIIANDTGYFKKGVEETLIQLIVVTHTGMSMDEFDDYASEFFNDAVYPGRNVPLKNITYRPQLELLKYLRDNGFLTYICTGGTIEFVRSISKDFYGIHPYQVIGTSFKYEYVDSSNIVFRKALFGSFNDKLEKPSNIRLHIGKKPVFACGNEGGGGDIAMLEYSQSSTYPSFQLMITHDDPVREFAYAENDTASLKASAKNKWHVVSMKNDWKNIFAE